MQTHTGQVDGRIGRRWSHWTATVSGDTMRLGLTRGTYRTHVRRPGRDHVGCFKHEETRYRYAAIELRCTCCCRCHGCATARWFDSFIGNWAVTHVSCLRILVVRTYVSTYVRSITYIRTRTPYSTSVYILLDVRMRRPCPCMCCRTTASL